MRLKHECVRDVLLCLEENLGLYDSITTADINQKLSKHSHEDIIYTCDKLDEAGYIKTYGDLGYDILITKITFFGHEFLDSIRDNSVWNEVKSKSKKLASISLSTLFELAKQVCLSKLGL